MPRWFWDIVMSSSHVRLDPQDVEGSLRQLAQVFRLDAATLALVERVIPLCARTFDMYLDDVQASYLGDLALADRFTFDIETDELVLFSPDANTLIDALIEMAMYLAGFLTMIGGDDIWVLEFTIGAWKPVKNRIKRGLGIPVRDRPSGVVGLPPPPERAPDDDPYPFRTLVSRYTLTSFQLMVRLAARDEITVYFPPETHPKVLAAYVYMRRAMQDVAKGVGIEDHAVFNSRLLHEIQRLENLFHPGQLSPEGWLHRSAGSSTGTSSMPDQAEQLGLFSSRDDIAPPDPDDPPRTNPFESFIDQLFPDEDGDSSPPAP